MISRARHTKVLEAIATDFGTLVREDHHQYPQSESNLYMVGVAGDIVWFAQRAVQDDVYPNPIVRIGKDRIRCFSGKGVECEIELKTGQLLRRELVR